MSATLEGVAMAKSKGRPKKATGEGTAVRLDSDVVSKAKYLASLKGMAMSEYLSNHLRPIVEREFRAAGRSLLEGDTK